MRTIYDEIIERGFQINKEGKTVYFPKGLRKAGYILPNKEKEDEIKKIINQYSTILISLFFIFAFLMRSLQMYIIFLLLMTFLHFVWYRRKIDLAIKELDISDFNPKLPPVNLHKSLGIVLIVIIVFILLLSGVWIPLIIRSLR